MLFSSFQNFEKFRHWYEAWLISRLIINKFTLNNLINCIREDRNPNRTSFVIRSRNTWKNHTICTEWSEQAVNILCQEPVLRKPMPGSRFLSGEIYLICCDHTFPNNWISEKIRQTRQNRQRVLRPALLHPYDVWKIFLSVSGIP